MAHGTRCDLRTLPTLVAFDRPGAADEVTGVDRARAIKPTIPETGIDGIALRDELILELRLDTGLE